MEPGRKVEVKLGERSYEIEIRSGLCRSAEFIERLRALAGESKALLATDTNVLRLYGALTSALSAGGHWLETTAFEAGEGSKTLSTIEQLCRAAAHGNLDRKSLFIALGGGVCGDMTGFAAGIYMRGTRFVQIPTTLLAMADSSVGGKTGVDLPEGKNLAGLFHQPSGVFIDPLFLRTLPKRELACGYAEIIKIGAVRDAGLFEILEKNAEAPSGLKDGGLLEEVLERSCRLKAEIVSGDEKETSTRALLNYGHTFGHAIEQLTGYSTIEHGEAVSLGIRCACELSATLGELKADEAERQKRLLSAFGLPTRLPDLDPEKLLERMKTDKKSVSGKPKYILTDTTGHGLIRTEAEDGAVLEAIRKSKQA